MLHRLRASDIDNSSRLVTEPHSLKSTRVRVIDTLVKVSITVPVIIQIEWPRDTRTFRQLNGGNEGSGLFQRVEIVSAAYERRLAADVMGAGKKSDLLSGVCNRNAAHRHIEFPGSEVL